MAKIGKLGKLKCIIKRWHSSAAHRSSPPSELRRDSDLRAASFNAADEVPSGYRPVYVGKSRRRYLVSSDLAGHPVFRNLIERSGDGAPSVDGGGETVVGCEVVLFEHLLWMLENGDPQPESLDELVEFYSC